MICAILLVCALLEVQGYPYPYYGSNFDTLSYGSSDSSRGGMVLSRYYNPYYNPRAVGGGMAAFMFKPEEQYQPQSSQYYVPDRRRQTPQEEYIPQQNEVYYPQVSEQVPEKPVVFEQPAAPEHPVTLATDIAEPTEKIEVQTTTLKTAVTPEITEPEIEEVEKPASTPRRRVTKKKQVKNTEEEDQEEGEEYPPRMPAGAYFPMFFGWGGRSGNTPQGATAIANAFSTGRGGVATSHATAYGPPQPEIEEVPSSGRSKLRH
ncbi:uncharacterized protein LOC121730633 [Aricia agestis]|uniref:uncharacterized protein LOC121730633 n=1 Tax=Aricia agestis TaxID=91739 RepID=UPI001C206954|nr:uncharacterized protein LOC121730633 [Aricia agestis]